MFALTRQVISRPAITRLPVMSRSLSTQAPSQPSTEPSPLAQSAVKWCMRGVMAYTVFAAGVVTIVTLDDLTSGSIHPDDPNF